MCARKVASIIIIAKMPEFSHPCLGIRANAVAPGGVKTQIEAPFKSELAASVLGPIFQSTATPLAEPEEVAGTITYLLSDDASNVNGAIVMCDGGWSVI